MAEIVKTGWLERLGKSVGGVLIGIGLFFGSFALLYWNEGRLDISQYAKTAVDVKADATAEGADGKLVDIAGTVTSDETLGDDLFLKPGNYLTFSRDAEIYAWVENVSSKTKKDAVGGGETTVKEYSYKKEWVSKADTSFNTTEVRDWERKYNVVIDNSKAANPLLEDASSKVSVVKMGKYTMNTSGLSLPGSSKLAPLDSSTLDTGKKIGGYDPSISSGYIYLRKSGGSGDQVGDERVTYSVLKSGFAGTAFGKLSGSELQSFTIKGKGGDSLKNKEVLYRVFASDKEQALETMHGEFVMWLWICRIIGFLMMFIGMTLVLDPISTVLDVVGFLGSISRTLINIVLFVIALVLSLVTIIIGAIAHNVIVLIVVLAILIGGVLFLVMQKKGGAPAAPTAPK